MKSQLPMTKWGHSVLYAASLIRLQATGSQIISLMQLAHDPPFPNIFHLRIFDCTNYVLIAPPQRIKMGPQRKLGIYVGFDSPSVIKYIEPLTGDLFMIHLMSLFSQNRRDKSVA